MLDSEFTLSAEADFDSIYAEKGDRFYFLVDRAISQLRSHPFSAPHYSGPFRRLILRGTNYGLFYAIEGRRIIIAALIDLRSDEKQIHRKLDL